MLKMIQKRLAIELSNEDAVHIQQNLQTRFNSLFYRIRLEYLNRLGLDASNYALTLPPADSKLILGELFMPEPGVICYIKGERGAGFLEVGVVADKPDHDLESFFADVREAICEVREDIPAWQLPEGYLPLNIEGADIGENVINAQEIAVARALMDSASRDLLAKIKDAGSIFLNKIYTEDRQDTEERIRKFEELKLINKEYAVLCRRTGQQILRVADRSTIDESSQKSFKCFICGHPIAEEVVEEIVTVDKLCAEMYNDNKWLLVLVQGILNDLGIENSALKVYRAPDLPTRLFLSLNGQRYMIVLCTEPLILDQANLIGAHIVAYNLHQAIVISTQSVSTLMRNHLAKSNADTTFHFIDNLTDLDEALLYILTEQQRVYLNEQLDDISAATPVSIPTLVLSRMMPKVEEPKVEEPKAEEPVVEAPVVEAPVVEAPVVEAPVVEAPVVEAPVVATPEFIAESIAEPTNDGNTDDMADESEAVEAIPVSIPAPGEEESVPKSIPAPGEEKSGKKHGKKNRK